MRVSDTFDFLLGHWKIERSIEDHFSGNDSHFDGSVSIVERLMENNRGRQRSALYDEHGEMHFRDRRAPAYRKLELVRCDDASLMINFETGLPFIRLDLRLGEWSTAHLCGRDNYEIASVVRSKNVMEEKWRVSGRSKEYEAVAILTRVA